MDWLVVAGGLGLIQAALMLLFAWEHRRFHRRRLNSPPECGLPPTVLLVVPCRGVDPQMDANLRALFELDYPRLELCFAVEARHDPAVDVIAALRREFPDRACRLVVAGRGIDCGQKVHNLIAATRAAGDACDVLAFVDSDARPHPAWLSHLVGRLESGKHSVATGYRWYAPAGDGWADRLLSAVNTTVVGVMGPHGFNLVWGGAWAIRREVFDQIGLPEAWRGSLSDDLIVSRLVQNAGLRVAYEPNALVVSPAAFTWGAAAEFLRRQFLVVRNYAPRWWHFGFWSGLAAQTLFWGLAAAATTLAAAGGQWRLPALCCAATYLLGVCRWTLTTSAVRPFSASGGGSSGQPVCRSRYPIRV